MYEFMEYVLQELRSSMNLVILTGIGAAAVLGISYGVFRRKYGGQRKFPWGRALMYLLLAGYLAVVAYATVLRGSGSFRSVNLHLFRAWREAWNRFSVKTWANVLLNVALFVPLGILLPLLWKRLRKWYAMIPTGFGVSLVIELAQLLLSRGVFDVDDLFANTLGAAMGYLLVMAVLSLFGGKGHRAKPCLIYGGLALAPMLAIGCIFLAYGLKEYGNLPDAPTYTVDTGDVQWRLDCQLPETGNMITVYQTKTWSIADCDAFAEAFARSIGTWFDDISYYEEAAYYMNHGSDTGAHFLTVSYLNGSFSYSGHWPDDAQWAEADRESVETALESFPVTIPDYAVFTDEGDGWYRFTVDRHMDDGVMMDGTLRCRYAQDGTVREVDNSLQCYAYYGEAEILTAEQAYARLCGGKFQDGGSFEYYAPTAVTVLSCSLEYTVDTKGFYQPVYLFGIASDDGSYQATVMIPARK